MLLNYRHPSGSTRRLQITCLPFFFLDFTFTANPTKGLIFLSPACPFVECNLCRIRWSTCRRWRVTLEPAECLSLLRKPGSRRVHLCKQVHLSFRFYSSITGNGFLGVRSPPPPLQVTDSSQLFCPRHTDAPNIAASPPLMTGHCVTTSINTVKKYLGKTKPRSPQKL